VSRIKYGLALLVVAALVVAGCGGGSDSSSGGAYGGKGGGGASANKPASNEEGGGSSAKGGYGEGGEASSGGDGIVSAAKVGDLGTILVTSQGLTLYDFHKDKGSKSACYDACAAAWPPLLTEGNPQAQGPADRSMLGTTKRTDGTVQVTYNGWPLYTYAGDQGPGEANGNDIDQFGAEWYALQPNGQEPED
jgi:predicted lipoprotein with Yx(FWY)xxD motif